jgi:hypothetical protein
VDDNIDVVFAAGNCGQFCPDSRCGAEDQGPGRKLGWEKPDFCAASHFCEDDDAFSINTGTSAACGLTGGIVAALRSRWNSTRVSPNQLKDI